MFETSSRQRRLKMNQIGKMLFSCNTSMLYLKLSFYMLWWHRFARMQFLALQYAYLARSSGVARRGLSNRFAFGIIIATRPPKPRQTTPHAGLPKFLLPFIFSIAFLTSTTPLRPLPCLSTEEVVEISLPLKIKLRA